MCNESPPRLAKNLHGSHRTGRSSFLRLRATAEWLVSDHLLAAPNIRDMDVAHLVAYRFWRALRPRFPIPPRRVQRLRPNQFVEFFPRNLAFFVHKKSSVRIIERRCAYRNNAIALINALAPEVSRINRGYQIGSASRSSSGFCRFNQNFGPVPKKWPRHKAVSSVIARSPFIIPVI